MGIVSEKITISAEYSRAINIERDDKMAISGYIITDNANRLLTDMGKNLTMKDAPRAFALVGPYGTGKSAFALYLSALLGDPQSKNSSIAENILWQNNPTLAGQYKSFTYENKGFCKILLSGAQEQMAPRLMDKMLSAVADFLGATHPAVKKLTAIKSNFAVSNITAAIAYANAAVVAHGGAGLLIVADELGKFLEYDAKDSHADNIFLLQALAELTLRRKKEEGNILFLGILHQGFEDYARKIGKDARADWSKVQGRFETLVFIESPEQMLRLTGRVIGQNFSDKENDVIARAVDAAAGLLWQQGIFPNQAMVQNVVDFCRRCYPLHPISAVLLSMLSEKMGQSERTLFSYLSGAQANGFAAAADNLVNIGDFIMPWSLYDYFLAGGLPVATDAILRRRWAEIQTAMDRLGGNAPQDQQQMLKTVALFNLVGARGKFAATDDFLRCIFAEQASPTIAALLEQSLITFRKHAKEYRIWQGSDFDLDGAIKKEMEKMAHFRLVDELNQHGTMPPIVAHKHAIQTGNLRCLDLCFIDAESGKKESSTSASPRLIIFLSRGNQDNKAFAEARKHFDGKNNILTESREHERLANVVMERGAIEKVIHSHAELQSDPIAMREVKSHLSAALHLENRLLSLLTAPRPGKLLYWQKTAIPIESRRALQENISRIMDEIYCHAPKVANELINRDKLSGAAKGACNKLLSALHCKIDKPAFGIDKYPPEKAMYLSLFKKSGLHRQVQGKWQLCKPEAENDPQNYASVWNRIEDFLRASTKERTLSLLDDELKAPPYGLKQGIIPIFYVSVLRAHKNDIAVYEDGKYSPFFDEPQMERFLIAPADFAFKHVPITRVNAPIVEDYRGILFNEKNKPRGGMLTVSKPLIKIIRDLPEYTQNTRAISDQARAFCSAVQMSKSPQDMLLEDIPEALGFTYERLTTPDARAKFVEDVNAVMDELKGAYPAMLNYFQEILAGTLMLRKDSPLSEIRHVFSGRVAGLDRYSIDKKGLLAFFQHIAQDSGDDTLWLNRILLFLVDKNPQKWDDSDKNHAEYKLAEYMRRMADLEKLRAFEANDRDGSFVLLRIISARAEYEGHVRLEKIAVSDKINGELEKLLKKIPSEKRLALLANALQSELSDTRKRKLLNVANE